MTLDSSATACCRVLYGHPLVELVLGESLHPGGIDGTRRLLAAASLARAARLLDAGCGSGATARLAADEFGLVVEGIDVSDAAIRRARERTLGDRGAVRFRTGDLRNLSYEAATFDAVLAECVLSTLPKRAALLELRRVLRPDGRLLLSDVRAEADRAATDEMPAELAAALCLGGAWRPGEADQLLGEAGFRVERQWDDGQLLETFVERAVAHVELLRVAGRDLELDLATITSALGARIGAHARAVDWRAGLAEIGRAVAGGSMGYFSLVARAV
ncbi:MAG: class I SAM-dependent methyltransferase [Chloroflexota bacterium]|nr:class I SAM-dependent methyltransferase [Chloroflexota bacterium]